MGKSEGVVAGGLRVFRVEGVAHRVQGVVPEVDGRVGEASVAVLRPGVVTALLDEVDGGLCEVEPPALHPLELEGEAGGGGGCGLVAGLDVEPGVESDLCDGLRLCCVRPDVDVARDVLLAQRCGLYLADDGEPVWHQAGCGGQDDPLYAAYAHRLGRLDA